MNNLFFYRGSLSFLLFVMSIFISFYVSASPVPDYYEEPGYSSERQVSGEAAEKEIIDPFGGGLQLQYIDMVSPGNGGLDIVIQRTYRSLQSQPGILGASYLPGRTSTGIGWDVHFGRVWTNGNPLSSSSQSGCKTSGISDANANPILELSDGSRRALVNSLTTSYAFITKDRWIAKCRTDGLDVYSPDGRRYIFNKSHNTGSPKFLSVTRIEDANGNFLNFNYSTATNNHGEYLLESIISNDNRQVSLSYDDKNGSNTLLRKITINNESLLKNQVMEYIYQPASSSGYYYLMTAVRPDSSRLDYTYYETSGAGLYSLKTVTGPHDVPRVNEERTTYRYQFHKFDSSIGKTTTSIATKSITNSGSSNGEWVYEFISGAINTTKITTPLGRIEYDHRGSLGVNTQVWRIGSLEEKRLYTGSTLTQTEKYIWDSQIISNQNQINRRYLGYKDNDVNAPILTKKTIIRDGTTYQTTYSNHDTYGNPRLVTESGNGKIRETILSYYINTNKWIIKRRDKETVNNVVTIDRTFDSFGNISSISNYGVTTNYTYTGDGDLHTIIDPRYAITRFSSYKRGIPLSEVHAEGKDEQLTVTRTVNRSGTVASETVDGKTTRFLYDQLNRISKIDKPFLSDININFTYSSVGITRTLNRGSYSETSTFDQKGRRKTHNGEGILVTTKYDANGNVISYSDPGVQMGTSFTYDILGRVLTKTHRDGTYIRHTYQFPNQELVRNERGKNTTLKFRSYGNPDERYLMDIESPENITNIGRNVTGNITSVRQGGKTRSYFYDSRNYIDFISHPETGVTQLSFDDNGNLKSKQVGSSGGTTYTYDALNRLVVTDFPGGAPDILNTYFPTGELKSVTKGASFWEYIYDQNRNLIKEKLTIGSDSSYAITYLINGNDEVRLVSYPETTLGKFLIDYNVDDLGRATTVLGHVSANNRELNVIDQVQYHPDGQIKKIEYSNGVVTDITQNTRRRVENLDVRSTSDVLVDRHYGYDSIGNTKTMTDYQNSLNSLTLGYDDINRLTDVGGSTVISYDTRGNLKTKNIGLNDLSYIYEPFTDRLANVNRSGEAWYSFSYDAYGNTVNNGFDTFVYDDESHLTEVTTQGISYEYDGNGNRFRSIQNDVTTHYVYTRSGLLMYEEKVGHAENSQYIYLGNQLVARVDECGDFDTDTDDDGLPDCVEIQAGLNMTNSADAMQDSDGDGLNNLQEYQAGTDYFNVDTDGDGMGDGFEVSFGLNPTDPLGNDAELDSDLDGLTNLQEYQLGTNPADADTDGDGVSDGDEVTAGTDPALNLPAVLVPIFHILLN